MGQLIASRINCIQGLICYERIEGDELKNKKLLYLFIVTLIAGLFCWPISINCAQCGESVRYEPLMARIAGRWEANFLCNLECTKAWLDEHPIERDEKGAVIPRR